MNSEAVIVMQSVTPEVLRELACWSEGPCVSVYLPLDAKHPSIAADRVGLKDLVADARRQLETTTSLRRPAIEELLVPVEALLVADRWPLGCRGYALFEAPGRSTHLRLDVEVPDIAVVADRFVVTPLVGDLPDAGSFYLLAISQGRVRFYQGRRSGLVEVDVAGLPTSRADALRDEHHERRLNVHGGSHQGVDRITGILHGSPSDRDLHKQQLLRFFRIVDEALWGVLHDKNVPLLVAGVEFELAVYREANHYRHLAATVDTGNPDRLDADELHAKIWPTAADLLDVPRRQLLERVASSADALTSLPTILTACHEGRVASLLVRPDHLSWGRADTTEEHQRRLAGDIDLVSATIAAALAQGATIYPVEPHELPRDITMAAVARY
jgi:hypothetical protein